jgi:hypothetical protein
MRILSLWQPWATLYVAPDPDKDGEPAKTWETRGFRPRHPLPIPVAIHATKTWNLDLQALTGRPPFHDALTRAGFYPGDARPFRRLQDGRSAPIATLPHGLRPLPLGAVIGVGTIVEVVRTEDAADWLDGDPWRAQEMALGNWSPGRYAWRLERATMLPEPIPLKGRQDVLWPAPLFVIEAVQDQLRAMEGS